MNQNGHRFARSLALGFVLLGGASFLHGQDAPEVQDNDTSPYHVALLDYKSGKFQEALDVLNPSGNTAVVMDERTVILESRILTELKRYDEAEKVLKNAMPPSGDSQIQLALGDLLLRKRSFDLAAKYYELALQAEPNDPDITLKIVYTRVGATDLIEAGKYASQLQPFDASHDPLDPKHPGNPSYYFAKAAIAQATGKSQEAEDDIQTARTLFGITTTNLYLKTYLEFFASADKGPALDVTPPPLLKPTPAGANP